jgi:serine/threonine-protein kinase RIM15
MAKTRIPSGADGSQASQSPITSPVLLSQEFSSPALPHHLQQMHRRQSSAAHSEVLRSTSPRPTPLPLSSNAQPRAAAPSIKDFEIIKPISKGAFGSVYLAKKKSTQEYFAVKCLKKADMIAKNQVTNVKAERAIMMWQGESDFVAKLYWTFANNNFLFLVMEYLNGGDCASLVKTLGGLPEEWSKRYIAEVVLGVQHLHGRAIIHRDLKPDNFLIDHNGHLKLTDFGLSRMGIVRRQKRAVESKEEDEPPAPDLLKQGPFHRAVSVGSSRSASFDFHGSNSSPSQTPSMTPSMSDLSQPSYFNLNKEAPRRPSGTRSDSEHSESLQTMLRKFSIADSDAAPTQSQSPIEEEAVSATDSPEGYNLQQTVSNVSGMGATPPMASQQILAANLALFDPEDLGRRFVGTPDYLAPETIEGVRQDEASDWWSLGCILFEFLYGYPPFNADTPEEVFKSILARNIHWPPEELDDVSPEAKDLMNKLMSLNPSERLGANLEGKFANGGEEIQKHPWFDGINWETLREDEASFIPQPDNPEDTEYFDARGATLPESFAEFEDQATSPPTVPTPGDLQDRPHDALSMSRMRTQVNSLKRGLIPLHIPPHVRDGRSRRLSEPVPADDFGNFNFKNLPVLERANKDVIQKLKAEAMQAQSKQMQGFSSPTAAASLAPSLESSPVVPMPLKRALSTNKGSNRPSSPLLYTQPTPSPNRGSQPSSPLLVQFSTGQYHERRKTSSSSSSLSLQTTGSLQPPQSFFDAPRLPVSLKSSSSSSSPIKLAKSPGGPLVSHERAPSAQRPFTSNPATSPRARSQTISSQESEDVVKDLKPDHKRRSQVFDNVNVSPSSSDNEDTRQKALLRVQRRRQSSRRLSQITLQEGPMFRPLDVLICDDHPVSRLVLEKLLERLRCRSLGTINGTEASRYAMSEVKFDIIFTEFKLPLLNGADLARMIRKTKNTNANTPIVAVTGYLKELPPNHFFDGLIDKPPTVQKLTDILGRLCHWRPPPPAPTALPWQAPTGLPNFKPITGYLHAEDSPASFSSSFGLVASGSYRGGSSREDSISSSFFGDNDSRVDEPLKSAVVGGTASSQGSGVAEEWQDRDLARNFEGLGITDFSTGGGEGKGLGVLQSPPFPALEHSISEPVEVGRLVQHQQQQHLQAPAVGDSGTVRRKRSSETKRLHASTASPDSADDEDDELGAGSIVRAKSPRNRPRGSSKLGTEMLRTNSRGSVVSVEEVPTPFFHPSQQGALLPPTSLPTGLPTGVQDAETPSKDVHALDFGAITPWEHGGIPEEGEEKGEGSRTPEEKKTLPLLVSVGENGEDGVEGIGRGIMDMDITPRPAASLAAGDVDGEERDPDPTPRPASSRLPSSTNVNIDVDSPSSNR